MGKVAAVGCVGVGLGLMILSREVGGGNYRSDLIIGKLLKIASRKSNFTD